MGLERARGKNRPAVEDECGLEHEIINAGQIQGAEFIPLGQCGDRVRSIGRLVWACADFHSAGENLWRDASAGEVFAKRFRIDPRIVDGEVRAFGEQIAADLDGRRFAGVVGE